MSSLIYHQSPQNRHSPQRYLLGKDVVRLHFQLCMIHQFFRREISCRCRQRTQQVNLQGLGSHPDLTQSEAGLSCLSRLAFREDEHCVARESSRHYKRTFASGI